jgi:hypothetical protein
MDNLPPWADVNPNLQARATLCPYDLALQPPGHARLVEDLQAIGGSIDMQMKALAALFTCKIQEEAVSYSRRSRGGSTTEQASKESVHHDLQGAGDLGDSVEEISWGPFYVPVRDCQALCQHRLCPQPFTGCLEPIILPLAAVAYVLIELPFRVAIGYNIRSIFS